MKKPEYKVFAYDLQLTERTIMNTKISAISAFYIGILVFTSTPLNAQETWSLSKCIHYALENNIAMQSAANNISLKKINLNESKAQLLPTINIGSNTNMSFGRSIDGSTNTITFDQTLSNNYGLSSSVDIFKGYTKYNSIGFNKYLLLASKEEATYVKNRLVIDILSAYYTVLYSTGLKDVAQSQVSLSKMQYKRMQKLVDIGRESQIVTQELKSQWASDKLNLVQTQNNYNKALLELKQLLRLDAQQSFVIDTINQKSFTINAPLNIDSLFKQASEVLPEIKQKKYIYQASQKDLAIAKGRISPSIYLSGGLFTGYFDGDPLAFQTQIKNNQNQGLSMGINIPIFNNASVASNIKRKKIALHDSELELQKEKDILYAEVWKVLDELQSSEKEYQSAKELYGFSELTLESATRKLENGLASSSEFEISKQRFAAAKASLLKAQLLYSLQTQIILFYETGSWDHL